MEKICVIKVLVRSLFVAVCCVVVAPVASAQSPLSPAVTVPPPNAYILKGEKGRFEMFVGTSRTIVLEDLQYRTFVLTPEENVITAVPSKANELNVTAVAPGIATVELTDQNGDHHVVTIVVRADVRALEDLFDRIIPKAALKVEAFGDSAALIRGTVTKEDEVTLAIGLAERHFEKVINGIQIVGIPQILVHFEIMEVSRTKLRDLGIDWGLGNSGNFGILSAPGGMIDVGVSALNNPITFVGQGTGAIASQTFGGLEFRAFLTALRQNNLVKLLAEPSIVSAHGRPARFKVGGRVPYVIPSNQGPTVDYEDFGTIIDVVGFVVGPGKVRLELRGEVSEQDDALGISLQGINIPGFVERSIDTAVELKSGETIAIAGLLQKRIQAVTRAVPFFGELPWFGSFFRRVTEDVNNVELLIRVRPEIVSAMGPDELPVGGPGTSTASPSDHELYIQGHIEVPNAGASDCNNEACGPTGAYSLPTPKSGPGGVYYPSSEPQVISDADPESKIFLLPHPDNLPPTPQR